MTLESRIKKLEKANPAGQHISILALDKPLDVAISEYEQEHNIKVDKNDQANIFTEIVLI